MANRHNSLLCHLLLLSLANCETYFVKPNDNSSCPKEDPCLTITEFASQQPGYFALNSTILLLPGEHLLTRSFSLRNLSELSFKSQASDESLTTISCLNGASFEISSISNVSISSVALLDCYGSRVTAVDRFVLEHSLVKGASLTNSTDAAIKFSGVQDISIFNCTFVQNRVAVTDRDGEGSTALDRQSVGCAALRVLGSNLSIVQSIFGNNSASATSDTGSGSALCTLSSELRIEGSSFTDNSGLTGGVIFADRSTVWAEGTSFINNQATLSHESRLGKCTSDGGDGGALHLSNNSALDVSDCLFQHNSAPCGTGGVLVLSSGCNASFSNSTFVENSARDSGVISAFKNTTLNLTESKFHRNRVVDPTTFHGYGAVLNTDGATIFMTGCAFVNNSASTSGGCGQIASSSSLHISGSSVFEGNHAIYGGAFTVSRGSIINIHKLPSTNSSIFFNNSAQHGGALNILENAIANIHDTVFSHNKANVNGSESRGGAILARTNSSVHLTDTLFHDNQATGQGGVIFAQFASLESSGDLIMDRNQGSSAIAYLTSCNVSVSGNSIFSDNKRSFLVHNSNVVFAGQVKFTGGVSRAKSESGAITAIRSQLYFSGDSFFEQNHGVHGGALLAVESNVVFGSSTFLNNSAKRGGGLYALKCEIRFNNDVTYQANNATESGGGIFATRSTLQFYSRDSAFVSNTAANGGAVYLDRASTINVVKEMMECTSSQAYWFCVNDTTEWLNLTFADNSARQKGGAIFVNDTDADSCSSTPFTDDTESDGECFLQTIATYERANDWDPLPVNFANVYFTNNTADSEGDTLYGGLLDRCSLDKFAEQKQLLHTVPHPFTYFSNIISQKSYSEDEIASDPVRLCLCENEIMNCSAASPPLNVLSGERFSLSIAVVDQVNQPLSGLVMAFLSSKSSRLGKDQSQQFVNSSCSVLEYNVFSASSETLHLYATGPCDGHGISELLVELSIDENCPRGFALSSTSLECGCDPEIQDYVSNCSINTKSVVREGDFWLSSDNVTDSFVIHDHCPYDYCYPAASKVEIDLGAPDGSDAQCAFNRSGCLCGSCAEGFSLTLGSTRCMKCTNYWLLLIIPFMLAGVALVALLMICNLTLAVGTINGPLFYANIVIANQATFFPFQEQNFFTVFVSWLGLNLGMATCFYDGMDSFGKTWVQISFELYLILLIVFIIVLGKSVRVSNFLHRYNLNPVHTLATLLLLSYEKLSRRIFSLLSFTTLRYGNETETLWLFDPSFKYLEGKHISLAVVAGLILIAGVTLNIVLLFSKAIISRSRSVYVNSFLEAFHAPFKSNHKYWAGLLLLSRNISYFAAEVLNTGKNPAYNLDFIFALVTGLLAMKFVYVCTASYSFYSLKNLRKCFRTLWNQSQHPGNTEKDGGIVYKSPILDLLETSFLVNLSVLTYFTLYLRDNTGGQGALFYVSSFIAFATFLGILFYHIFRYVILKFVKVSECESIEQSRMLDVSREDYGSAAT